MEAEDILKKVKLDKRHISEWRTDAKECYDFYAGDQWSDDDKATLEEEDRIPVVFNRIVRALNTVAGLEVQNRQEVRYIPRENTDTGVNDVLTSAAKWVRDNCDAEDEESEAFIDMLISGMGWTETRLDYETDPDGQIIEDRVDPLEMGWDHRAKKRNIDDAKHLWRIREYSKDELEKEWGEEAVADINPSDFWIDPQGEPHDATEAWKYEDDQGGQISKNSIPVIHFQWYEKEPYHRVLSQNGRIVELSQNKYAKLKDFIERSSLKHVSMKKRVYYQAFVAGNKILKQGKAPCQDGFSFRAITGLRNRNENYWFGLVALMRDPQRWANKWLSQIMHIINTNSKGGLLAEQDAFANPRKAEDEWARPDAITWVNPGGLGKVEQKQMAQYPSGVDRLLEHAMQAISDVPGVSIELMAMSGQQQSGYLEAVRKQSGITVLATFFDSLRRYRKEQGRLLAYFIKEYISDGRLIRVVGEQGAQYVPLLKDQMTYKYDVVVDDAPTSPNMKEKVFGIMMELMPAFTQAGFPIPPEIVEYTPLPEQFTMKWKQMMQPDPQAQQLQQIAQEMEMRDKEAQIEETASKTVLNYAKAEKESAVAKDEAAQALQKLGISEIEARAKVESLLREQQIKEESHARDQARKDDAFIREQQRKDLAAQIEQNRKTATMR